MIGTSKVKIKNGKLIVENSDMLKPANKGKAAQYLTISPFHVRTEVGVSSLGDGAVVEGAVVKAATKMANEIEAKLQGYIHKLVGELEICERKDKSGDDKAGDTAAKKVKDASDEIDEELPDFGTHIRKYVEKSIGKKIPGSVRSVSTGQFRGLKLKFKFEHGGSLAETVKDFKDAAKTLAEAGKEAVEQNKEAGELLTKFKAAVSSKYKEVSAQAKTSPKNDPRAIKASAQELGSLATQYTDKLGSMQDTLKSMSTDYEKEQRGLKGDLASNEFKSRRDTLTQVGTQLTDLKKAVDKSATDSKQIPSEFREAESITEFSKWHLRLAALNTQVARLTPPNATKFADALKKMNTESDRKL
jgi:hypothetical protein